MKKKPKVLKRMVTVFMVIMCVCLLCVPAFASAPEGFNRIEVPLSFVFDGDTSGKEIIDLGDGTYFVKMTDAILTMDDLNGTTLTMAQGEEEMSVDLVAEFIADINGDGSILGTEGFLAVQRDATWEGIELTPGLHFPNYGGGVYTKSLIKEGATVFVPVEFGLDSVLVDAGNVVTSLTSWVGSVARMVINTPVLLIGFTIGLATLAFGVFKGLKR